jgi:hypothetical protein
MSIIKGQFVSMWEEGAVHTHCELNEDTGELFPDTVEVGDLGSLEKEFFQTPNGNETPVCSTCHGFILRPAMTPDIGHTLREGMQCSDPECESHNE